MRLLCIPVLLAVASRPVGVVAHAKPTEIVLTDSQSGVQRHLRVQEVAHDKYDDERTNFQIKDIMSSMGLEDAATWLNLAIPHSDPLNVASDSTIIRPKALKRPAEMLKNEDTPEKRKQKSVVYFGKDDAHLKNMVTKEGEAPEYPFSKIMTWFKENGKPSFFEEMNKGFLEKNCQPDEVFELYEFDVAKDKLFEQPQLVYWVKYVDDFNDKNPESKKTLLDRLLGFYSIETLCISMIKVKENKVTFRVTREIQDLWYKQQDTPDDAFTRLHLDRPDNNPFESPLLIFWVKYLRYYNLMKPKKDQRLFFSVFEKHVKSWFDVLIRAEKNEFTPFVEQIVANALLGYWKKTSASDEYVRAAAAKIRDTPSENTVCGSALLQAAKIYESQK